MPSYRKAPELLNVFASAMLGFDCPVYETAIKDDFALACASEDYTGQRYIALRPGQDAKNKLYGLLHEIAHHKNGDIAANVRPGMREDPPGQLPTMKFGRSRGKTKPMPWRRSGTP